MESICFILYVQWTENGQTCLVALRIWSSVVIFLVAENTFHFGFFFFLLANNFYTTFFEAFTYSVWNNFTKCKKSCLCWTKKGNLFSAISNCILWKTIWKQPITVYNAKHSVFCIRQTHQNWRGYLKIFFNADSITFLYVLQIPWCLVWWDNIKFPVFFPSSYSKQEHHWSSCSRSQNKVSL